MEQYGFYSSLVHQAIESNDHHKQRVIQDIITELEKIKGNKVTLFGLSFKANTNDIRNSPALEIIPALLHAGIEVIAYDPQAIKAMSILFPDIRYCECPYEAAQGTDCMVILTEWDEIKNLNLEHLASVGRSCLIIDTRNVFNTIRLRQAGFSFLTMGALS